MSEEQTQILRMLAERKITAEQAEALLAAVDKSTTPAAAPAREAMDKLGKVIGGLVTGADGMPWRVDSSRAEDGEEAGPGGLVLPEDTEMVLKVRSGRVRVRRGDEPRELSFATDTGTRPRVRVAGRTCRVSIGPDCGATEATVPSLRSLKIRLTGGRVDVEGVGCSIRADARGGDLSIAGCEGLTSVKCMGGTISVSGHPDRLDAACMGGSLKLDGLLIHGGRHKAKVLGGDMTVLLSPRSSLRIETKVLGGGVQTDLQQVGESGGRVKQTSGYVIGDGDGLLSISVLGGAVTIAEAEAAAGGAGEPVKEQA